MSDLMLHSLFWKIPEHVQKIAKLIIGHCRVSNSFVLLEHLRNMGCDSLFYRLHNGIGSSEIMELVAETRWLLCSNFFLSRTHPFVVNWPVYRTTHYQKNLFFCHTIRKWNKLSAEVFPVTFTEGKFINTTLSFRSTTTNFPSSCTMLCSCRCNTLSDDRSEALKCFFWH